MKTIHGRQITCLALVVLTGWSLTMTAGNGRDGWISLTLAALLSLPFAAVCCLPAEQLPQNDWFDLPQAAFGKGFGAVYLLILTALAFWSLCMTVLSGVIFLRTVSGGAWAVWLLTAAILLTAACAAQSGVRRLVLWTEPVVWLVVIALAVSLLLSIRQLDFANLQPMLSDGGDALPMQTYLLLSVPFGEIFYAAAVVGGSGRLARTGLLRGCLLAGVLLTLLYVRNLALLGEAGAQAVSYPSYTAASVLEFGESFQRGEVLISGSLIVCTVARAALMLVFLGESVEHITGQLTRTKTVWGGAIVAGIVCVLVIGTNGAYARALQLYQILLLPLVLLAAVLLYVLTKLRASRVQQ